MDDNNQELENQYTGMEIAVIGMDGKFPGASNLEKFWNNLEKGKETISLFTVEELAEAGVSSALLENANYVPARGILEEKEYFDASFFDYIPLEATIMDPQIRLFHQCSWRALEDAGYDPDSYAGAIGVYAGASSNLNWEIMALLFAGANGIDGFTATQLSNKDFISTRISYKLNLRGPAVFVQTACSTSLVAIHMACRAILSGECDMALAGGVTAGALKKCGYLYQDGMIYSKDGHCRAFDAQADGMVPGEGVGVVVLKALENAIEDRDNIHAVVKASAINNDGVRKVGYSAPSIQGQSEAIREALYMAEVEPESIGCVETHGTATALGDPVEIEALVKAYNSPEKQFCAVGSIKSNVGHLDSAAGAASFIKTVLALKHRLIPPSLHYQSPNPQIDFQNTPFYVNTTLQEWDNSGHPRRAGVSSFGIGGTNAHVILEEAPEPVPSSDVRQWKLLLLSAKNSASLGQGTQNLLEYFKKNPGTNPADAAYTLQVGRKAFSHRKIAVCSNIDEATEALADSSGEAVETSVVDNENPPVVFMFPGQGSQYENMALDLYESESVFREEMDKCFEILAPLTEHDLKGILFPAEGLINQALPDALLINQTIYTQPLIFAIEYSLAKLLISWGVEPYAMMGHSIGEYTAACLAGVFSLEDALVLTYWRGKLMQSMPPGDMLSVALTEEELEPFLAGSDLELAAHNGPSLCVVSGTAEAVEALAGQLTSGGHKCRVLKTSHAFHSRMMEPILSQFEEKVKEITLNKPDTPFISNLTGNWITADDAVDPGYWVRHLRRAVRFSDGLETLFHSEARLFLEVGPGKALSTFVRQHPQKKSSQAAFNLVRHPREDTPDDRYLLWRIGQLWLQGVTVNWREFYKNEQRNRLSLPAYSFQQQSFWLEGAEPFQSGMKSFRVESRVSDTPGESQDTSPGAHDAPVTGTQQQLAQIFQRFFGIGGVGINRDFFELGGDSLKAMTFLSLLHKELSVKISLTDLFRNPTIRGLAAIIDESGKEQYAAIPSAGEKEYYPVTPAQRRLYILQQMEDHSVGYNMPRLVPLQLEPDVKQFEEILKTLIQRHEIFRTSFEMIDDIPVQEIHPEVSFALQYHQVNTGDEVRRLIRDFVRPFDLGNPPLLRAALVQQEPGKCLLLLDNHHIISDGTSQELFIHEFISLFKAQSLPELRLRYVDYAQWLQDRSGEGVIQGQERYWLDRFGGEIPVLNLPTDYPRPVMQSFEGTSAQFQIDEKETAALNTFAADHDMTLYMLLLAAVNTWLSKMSGQEDIVIGTPTAGRRHADLESIIGVFINTLPLRNYPRPESTVTQFLREVRQNTLDDFENQEYPFEELVENLQVERDISRNPLFDVMLMLHNIGKTPGRNPESEQFTGGDSSGYELESKISNFDITLTGVESDGRLRLIFEYCTRLFTAETIHRFAGYFKQTLRAMLEDPNRKLADLEIIPPAERKQLLYDFNDTRVSYDEQETVHQLFRRQAAQTPGETAIIFDEQEFDYRYLDRRSDELAGTLIGKGIGTGQLVGIMVERSPEMIIGLLGILKSGAAYVPIDPVYPAERIAFMLKDAGCSTLLVNFDISGNPPDGLNGDIIDLREPSAYVEGMEIPGETACADDPAYVIYTSGSTGFPKGVVIPHRALHNFFVGMRGDIDFSPGKTILALTTINFDIFVLETLLPLTTGMRVVLSSEDQQTDSLSISRLIHRHSVGMMQVTPSRMQLLLNDEEAIDCLKRLQVVMLGGEALPQELFNRIKDLTGARIYNMYGPTETTVWSAVKDLTQAEKVNIGKPIANTRVYILDKHYRPCPLGVTGDLYIAGDGLAIEYLNDAEKTAKAFVHDVFYPGERMYRTGDCARWLPDGDIDFMGRSDYQVKIRGYRIELAEIEKHLAALEPVKEAVVVDRQDGDGVKYLCAYFVSDEEIDSAQLLKLLSQNLPQYMVPSYFVKLDQIPLTPNGKVNRKALPEPQMAITAENLTAPRNEIEASLVQIWSHILEIDPDRIGIESNFFQLGGHSLRGTAVIGRVQKQLHVRVTLADIFKNPTVKELAQHIGQAVKERYESIPRAKEKEYYALSSAQKRLYFMYQVNPDSIGYNMPMVERFSHSIDRERLRETFRKLIQRHESLRTSFDMVDELPVQRIHPEVPFEIEYESLTPGSPRDITQVTADFIRPFDLSIAPLLRVKLVQESGSQSFVMVDMHHIITDALSIQVMLNEFNRLYRGEPLTPLTIQYKDFAQWQSGDLQKKELKRQEAFWLNKFNGDIPTMDIITDYPRPGVSDFKGRTLWFSVGEEETRKLKALAEQEDASLFMIMLAVYNVLMWKITGQQDILIGSPVSGRRHADLREVIGFFVNMVVMRNHLDEEKNAESFILDVIQRTLEVFENQDYQFDDLVEKLGIKRGTSHHPLFDVVFTLQDMPGSGDAGEEVPENTDYSPPLQYDMIWTGNVREKTILFSVEYRTQLFKESTIKRYIDYYCTILSKVLDNPGLKLGDIVIAQHLSAEKPDLNSMDFNF